MELLKTTRIAVLTGTPILYIFSVDSISYLFSIDNTFFLMYWLFFPMLTWLVIDLVKIKDSDSFQENKKGSDYKEKIVFPDSVKIVAVILLAVLVIYFIASPYQNCMRDIDNTRYCINKTNW